MKNKIITTISTLLISSSSFALNLQETLTATYQNNPELKSNQQLFLQNIESYHKAFSRFMPDIGASVTTSNTKQKNDSQYDPKATSNKSGPDVSRAIGIRQNIFEGGRGVLGLKSAQASFWIARSKLYENEQKILYNAIKAYLDIYETRTKLKIAEESVAFHAQNVNMVEEKIKVGEATITDVALAKSKLAGAEAKKSSAHASNLAALAAFKATTSLEPTEDMSLPEIPSDLPETQEQFADAVKRSNLDLITAKYTLSQAKTDAKASLAALLPSADIKLQAGKNYYNEEFPGSRFSSGRMNNMSYTTSLEVNIPIYSRGGIEHASIRQNKKAVRQSVYTLDNAEKQLKSYVINYWENFTASKDSIIYSEKAVEAQALAVEGIRQEYAVGQKTMIEVLTSQEDLNAAKAQAVEAKKNYILTSYKMKDLMGQLTASQLKLPVKYFNPEYEFKMVKHKIIGF